MMLPRPGDGICQVKRRWLGRRDRALSEGSGPRPEHDERHECNKTHGFSSDSERRVVELERRETAGASEVAPYECLVPSTPIWRSTANRRTFSRRAELQLGHRGVDQTSRVAWSRYRRGGSTRCPRVRTGGAAGTSGAGMTEAAGISGVRSGVGAVWPFGGGVGSGRSGTSGPQHWSATTGQRLAMRRQHGDMADVVAQAGTARVDTASARASRLAINRLDRWSRLGCIALAVVRRFPCWRELIPAGTLSSAPYRGLRHISKHAACHITAHHTLASICPAATCRTSSRCAAVDQCGARAGPTATARAPRSAHAP